MCVDTDKRYNTWHWLRVVLFARLLPNTTHIPQIFNSKTFIKCQIILTICMGRVFLSYLDVVLVLDSCLSTFILPQIEIPKVEATLINSVTWSRIQLKQRRELMLGPDVNSRYVVRKWLKCIRNSWKKLEKTSHSSEESTVWKKPSVIWKTRSKIPTRRYLTWLKSTKMKFVSTIPRETLGQDWITDIASTCRYRV